MLADSIGAKLEKLKHDVRREWQPRIRSVRGSVKRASWREIAAALLFALLKALAVVALPFLVYVRTPVYLYRRGAHPWMAILISWCVYAAFYLSRVNVKSDDVRAYYSAVWGWQSTTARSTTVSRTAGARRGSPHAWSG